MPPAPGQPVQVFPVSQVKPGMKATGYTVFQGNKVEAFPVEILGVLKNQWGPRQHIILARVGGDKVTATGVAAGMSGSPIYIDGKLLGALSLRFGPFPSEPIAGITPAELMMEISELDNSRGPGSSSADRKVPMPAEFRPASPRPTSGPGEAFLTPIETPLVFTGLHEGVLAQFADAFRQTGVMAVQGAAGSTISDSRVVTDPEELKRALPPGSALSGMLITGDLAAGATGTVTYNDGRRVLAFGHPFLNFGQVEMPLAQADVITVFGSSFLPFKITNSTDVVGVLRQDRHSGVLGVLGESARMIPVEASVRLGEKVQKFRYEVFQNPKFTPLLVMVACFNSLAGTNYYGDEATYRVNGSIKMDGLPELKLNNLFTNAENPNSPAPSLGASFWIGERFMRIFNNSFETPKITSVKFDFDVTPERRTATIDQVTVDRTEVRPGETVNLKVYLRPYRGERVVRDVQLTVPVTAPKGDLRVMFSDPDVVNRSNNIQLAATRLPGLTEMISLLNREQGNGRLYVTMLQATPTGYVEDKVMPQLPSSVANVIDPNHAQNRLIILGQSVVLEQTIPVDYVVSGSQMVSVRVK